jgi:hypothetical protein
MARGDRLQMVISPTGPGDARVHFTFDYDSVECLHIRAIAASRSAASGSIGGLPSWHTGCRLDNREPSSSSTRVDHAFKSSPMSDVDDSHERTRLEVPGANALDNVFNDLHGR